MGVFPEEAGADTDEGAGAGVLAAAVDLEAGGREAAVRELATEAASAGEGTTTVVAGGGAAGGAGAWSAMLTCPSSWWL